MTKMQFEAISDQAIAGAGVVYFLAALATLAAWAAGRKVVAASAREAVMVGAGASAESTPEPVVGDADSPLGQRCQVIETPSHVERTGQFHGGSTVARMPCRVESERAERVADDVAEEMTLQRFLGVVGGEVLGAPRLTLQGRQPLGREAGGPKS